MPASLGDMSASLTNSDPPCAESCQIGPGTYIVLYDDQCEVCQSCVAWLKTLDVQKLTSPVPLSQELISRLDKRLMMDQCLRQLHVIDPDGQIHVGWDAVARLARLFRPTWLIGALGGRFPFRSVGQAIYGFVARNRYALSKCRGGVCRTVNTGIVKKKARLGTFWSCYTFGFLIRFPLILWAGISDAAQKVNVFARTRGKRFDFLGGKLTLLILNGTLPNLVPVLFGELFTAVLYDGVVIDPGSPKMRRSLDRHLRRGDLNISAVVATHAHEEHVGNLNWFADLKGVPLFVSEMTAQFLMPFKKLPWVRATIIGQPPDLRHPFQILPERLPVHSGELLVIPSPGHCDDHVVLYDPKEKVLLAGDAFMGTYFATPNPDVDSRKWLDTLERLLELEIDILVEGHGHIHTLRTDIPDFPGIVVREDPKTAMLQKLAYLRWLREQIEAGSEEKLPMRAIEATCFPWGKRSSWETCANDECIRILSLGHFSRTELIRSFARPNDKALPTAYEIRVYRS